MKRRRHMNTHNQTTRDKTSNKTRQAIAGVQKHLANIPTLALGGTPTTPTDVIATLQGAIDAIDAAAAAEKVFHDAVAAQHAAIVKGNALLKVLKMLVHNQLGSTEGVLGDFGFTSPKRQTPNEATKAAAVAMPKRREWRGRGCHCGSRSRSSCGRV